MQKIEVVTAQNVTIEYNLASVIDRIVALILDLIVMGFSFLLLLFISGVTGMGDWLLMFFYFFCFIAYDMCFETFNNGMTPGKSMLRIKVIKLNGDSVSAYDAFVRWAFKLIDVYFCLGSVAGLFVVASDKNQRLGDYLASTAVIKVNRKGRMSLDRIMAINEEVNYVPVFPEVAKLNNEEVLLIHETVNRLKKYKNEVHVQASEKLSKKIEERLGVNANQEPLPFFNTLIKDYVYLTR